jgi:hypothetical protein
LGFLQITRTVPFRLMILQLMHIFFTDDRTFMGLFLFYLYRYVIRPLDKS